MAGSLPPIPLATDTPLTLLTRYSKAPKRAAANCPRGQAVPRRERLFRYRLHKCSSQFNSYNYKPTCIAPMFSISWSVLDAPKRTELTPSLRRHHAAGDQQITMTRQLSIQHPSNNTLTQSTVCQPQIHE